MDGKQIRQVLKVFFGVCLLLLSVLLLLLNAFFLSGGFDVSLTYKVNLLKWFMCLTLIMLWSSLTLVYIPMLRKVERIPLLQLLQTLYVLARYWNHRHLVSLTLEVARNGL